MKTIIENLVPILLGLLVSGIGASIRIMVSLRKDSKKTRDDVGEALDIIKVLASNVGAITSCAELHLKATRSNVYATDETRKGDVEAAKESIVKAHDFTNRAEDILSCQRDENTRAAMAVGGR